MTAVTTLRELLIDALQDLYEGEVATRERLPALIRSVDDVPLAEVLRARLDAAETRAPELEALAQTLDDEAHGPKNLWMSAMLGDAARDTRTVRKGPLLDAALVGAVRKMAAASLVSYETAMAAARQLGLDEPARAFERLRDEERACDDALRERLGAVVTAGDAGPR